MSSAYIYLGHIIYNTPIGPHVFEIWVTNSMDLAAEWEKVRLAYYPDYVGPPPSLLEEVQVKAAAYAERRGMI